MIYFALFFLINEEIFVGAYTVSSLACRLDSIACCVYLLRLFLFLWYECIIPNRQRHRSKERKNKQNKEKKKILNREACATRKSILCSIHLMRDPNNKKKTYIHIKNVSLKRMQKIFLFNQYNQYL
jgi:hypothetical protein